MFGYLYSAIIRQYFMGAYDVNAITMARKGPGL